MCCLKKWTLPKPNFANEIYPTMKTLTNRKHAAARARSWLARKHGRMSRMYLRRRGYEPERMQRCLRRSYIGWQAETKGETEKHTPRLLRGVRGMQDTQTIQYSCKRTTLLFQSRSEQTLKSRRRFENGFWIFNRLPNGLRYPLVGGTRQRCFTGINSKSRKVLENAQTPTSRVHALLGGSCCGRLAT